MANYTVERFVKIETQNDVIGRGDVFEWRFVKTGFESHFNAAEYAKAHPDYRQGPDGSGFRVTIGADKWVC